MDKFIETYNLRRVNQEKIKNLNRPITNTETEWVIKNPTNKNPGPNGFYKIIKEDLTPIILNNSKKLKRKECFQTCSMRPALPLF